MRTEQIEKLRAYEDTGLEPEEAKAKCAWADNTCKLLDGVFGGSGVFDFTHIKELLTAESEGRLVILPCKVGDVLHRIHSMNHIEEDRVMGFLVSTYGVWYWDENYRETPIEKIGKTVFLAREEAEEALRGVADNA